MRPQLRLRILTLVAQHPRSTQELAPLIGLTEAGTSKHLRLLAAAGVLETRREGYYVVYSLASDRLVSVARELRDLTVPTPAARMRAKRRASST